MRCEVATFPIRFGKLSPPLFCYFSSSAALPWFGMQQPCGSPRSLFSCQSPLCTKMLIGPNPPLEAVLVAWPRTLKDTLVWNTKEPIQVTEKRGTEHSNTIQFPSPKTGGGEGGRRRGGGRRSWGRVGVLTINQRYKATVMCCLTITSQPLLQGIPTVLLDSARLIAWNPHPARAHTHTHTPHTHTHTHTSF